MLSKLTFLQKSLVLCASTILLLIAGSSDFSLTDSALFDSQTAEASTSLLATPSNNFNVLVFSKTEGFRHNSIEPAIQFLNNSAAAQNWTIKVSEDSAEFKDTNLANFDIVVFLLTTGDVLNNEQQSAFERYIQAGGGYVGIHSASDTEHDWPWYGGLVGAYFNDHPAIQTAEINRSNQLHSSNDFLPSPWVIEDEWYNFKTNPSKNDNIKVLLRLDESTYSGGWMGDHPISWYQFYDGGRAWYTGIGHRSELYTSTTDTLFQQHVIAGIEWAADKNNVPIDPNALNNKTYLPIIVTN